MPVTFEKVVNSKIKKTLREIRDHSKDDFHQQLFGAVEYFANQKNRDPKR